MSFKLLPDFETLEEYLAHLRGERIVRPLPNLPNMSTPGPQPRTVLTNPIINPFFQDYKAKSRWTQDKFFDAMNHSREYNMIVTMTGEENSYQIAGDSRFADDYVPMPWKTKSERKRMAEILIFRYGKLNDSHIIYILNKFKNINHSNFPWARNQLLNYEKTVRDATCKFFLKSMTHLVELVGPAEFAAATDEERGTLIRSLFNYAKLTCCKNAFSHESNVVDFEGFYRCGLTAWQKVVEAKFVALALKTYHSRIASQSDDKKAVFELWKGMVTSQGFRTVTAEICTAKDVPVQARG